MIRKARRDPAANPTAQSLRKMRPEARVNLAAEMSSTVAAITLGSILDRNPRISNAKLLEEARRRFRSGRRTR